MKAIKYLPSIAPLVLLAVLALGAAAPQPPVATALVAGPVFLNGRLVSGSSLTLNDGDRLQTGPRGGAVVAISRQDGLVLSENSAMSLLARRGGVAAELDRGRLLVNSAHERLREVRLTGEAVSIRSAPGSPRRYQIARLPDNTYVLARTGTISVYDEGYATHTEVPEGRAAEIRPEAEVLEPPQRKAAPPAQKQPAPAAAQAPAPSGSGARAGQISVAIPADYIVRGPQRTLGNRGDLIQWNDLVETEIRGRVRLGLDDGSILNVGSQSQLRVIQHDNRTQQTALQLSYGRMRAQVVRLSQPGASFQVRTNTAVCGVLGTDFYIEADQTSTRVIVFKGIVRVVPLLAGALAGVTVGAGQAVTAGASTISAPLPANVSQVQGALGSTQATVGMQTATAAVSTSRVVLLVSVPPGIVATVTVPAFTEGQVSPFVPVQ